MKDRMLLDGTTARATQRVTSAWNATTRACPVLSSAAVRREMEPAGDWMGGWIRRGEIVICKGTEMWNRGQCHPRISAAGLRFIPL